MGREDNERERMTKYTIHEPNDFVNGRIEIDEKATELERLRAENERLREALKPFAYYASLIPDDISDTCSASGTVGDLRAALKALGETE